MNNQIIINKKNNYVKEELPQKLFLSLEIFRHLPFKISETKYFCCDKLIQLIEDAGDKVNITGGKVRLILECKYNKNNFMTFKNQGDTDFLICTSSKEKSEKLIEKVSNFFEINYTELAINRKKINDKIDQLIVYPIDNNYRDSFNKIDITMVISENNEFKFDDFWRSALESVILDSSNHLYRPLITDGESGNPISLDKFLKMIKGELTLCTVSKFLKSRKIAAHLIRNYTRGNVDPQNLINEVSKKLTSWELFDYLSHTSLDYKPPYLLHGFIHIYLHVEDKTEIKEQWRSVYYKIVGVIHSKEFKAQCNPGFFDLFSALTDDIESFEHFLSFFFEIILVAGVDLTTNHPIQIRVRHDKIEIREVTKFGEPVAEPGCFHFLFTPEMIIPHLVQKLTNDRQPIIVDISNQKKVVEQIHLVVNDNSEQFYSNWEKQLFMNFEDKTSSKFSIFIHQKKNLEEYTTNWLKLIKSFTIDQNYSIPVSLYLLNLLYEVNPDLAKQGLDGYFKLTIKSLNNDLPVIIPSFLSNKEFLLGYLCTLGQISDQDEAYEAVMRLFKSYGGWDELADLKEVSGFEDTAASLVNLLLLKNVPNENSPVSKMLLEIISCLLSTSYNTPILIGENIKKKAKENVLQLMYIASQSNYPKGIEKLNRLVALYVNNSSSINDYSIMVNQTRFHSPYEIKRTLEFLGKNVSDKGFSVLLKICAELIFKVKDIELWKNCWLLLENYLSKSLSVVEELKSIDAESLFYQFCFYFHQEELFTKYQTAFLEKIWKYFSIDQKLALLENPFISMNKKIDLFISNSSHKVEANYWPVITTIGEYLVSHHSKITSFETVLIKFCEIWGGIIQKSMSNREIIDQSESLFEKIIHLLSEQKFKHTKFLLSSIMDIKTIKQNKKIDLIQRKQSDECVKKICYLFENIDFKLEIDQLNYLNSLLLTLKNEKVTGVILKTQIHIFKLSLTYGQFTIDELNGIEGLVKRSIPTLIEDEDIQSHSIDLSLLFIDHYAAKSFQFALEMLCSLDKGKLTQDQQSTFYSITKKLILVQITSGKIQKINVTWELIDSLLLALDEKQENFIQVIHDEIIKQEWKIIQSADLLTFCTKLTPYFKKNHIQNLTPVFWRLDTGIDWILSHEIENLSNIYDLISKSKYPDSFARYLFKVITNSDNIHSKDFKAFNEASLKFLSTTSQEWSFWAEHFDAIEKKFKVNEENLKAFNLLKALRNLFNQIEQIESNQDDLKLFQEILLKLNDLEKKFQLTPKSILNNLIHLLQDQVIQSENFDSHKCFFEFLNSRCKKDYETKNDEVQQIVNYLSDLKNSKIILTKSNELFLLCETVFKIWLNKINEIKVTDKKSNVVDKGNKVLIEKLVDIALETPLENLNSLILIIKNYKIISNPGSLIKLSHRVFSGFSSFRDQLNVKQKEAIFDAIEFLVCSDVITEIHGPFFEFIIMVFNDGNELLGSRDNNMIYSSYNRAASVFIRCFKHLHMNKQEHVLQFYKNVLNYFEKSNIFNCNCFVNFSLLLILSLGAQKKEPSEQYLKDLIEIIVLIANHMVEVFEGHIYFSLSLIGQGVKFLSKEITPYVQNYSQLIEPSKELISSISKSLIYCKIVKPFREFILIIDDFLNKKILNTQEYITEALTLCLGLSQVQDIDEADESQRLYISLMRRCIKLIEGSSKEIRADLLTKFLTTFFPLISLHFTKLYLASRRNPISYKPETAYASANYVSDNSNIAEKIAIGISSTVFDIDGKPNLIDPNFVSKISGFFTNFLINDFFLNEKFMNAFDEARDYIDKETFNQYLNLYHTYFYLILDYLLFYEPTDESNLYEILHSENFFKIMKTKQPEQVKKIINESKLKDILKVSKDEVSLDHSYYKNFSIVYSLEESVFGGTDIPKNFNEPQFDYTYLDEALVMANDLAVDKTSEAEKLALLTFLITILNKAFASDLKQCTYIKLLLIKSKNSEELEVTQNMHDYFTSYIKSHLRFARKLFGILKTKFIEIDYRIILFSKTISNLYDYPLEFNGLVKSKGSANLLLFSISLDLMNDFFFSQKYSQAQNFKFIKELLTALFHKQFISSNNIQSWGYCKRYLEIFLHSFPISCSLKNTDIQYAGLLDYFSMSLFMEPLQMEKKFETKCEHLEILLYHEVFIYALDPEENLSCREELEKILSRFSRLKMAGSKVQHHVDLLIQLSLKINVDYVEKPLEFSQFLINLFESGVFKYFLSFTDNSHHGNSPKKVVSDYFEKINNEQMKYPISKEIQTLLNLLLLKSIYPLDYLNTNENFEAHISKDKNGKFILSEDLQEALYLIALHGVQNFDYEFFSYDLLGGLIRIVEHLPNHKGFLKLLHSISIFCYYSTIATPAFDLAEIFKNNVETINSEIGIDTFAKIGLALANHVHDTPDVIKKIKNHIVFSLSICSNESKESFYIILNLVLMCLIKNITLTSFNRYLVSANLQAEAEKKYHWTKSEKKTTSTQTGNMIGPVNDFIYDYYFQECINKDNNLSSTRKDDLVQQLRCFLLISNYFYLEKNNTKDFSSLKIDLTFDYQISQLVVFGKMKGLLKDNTLIPSEFNSIKAFVEFCTNFDPKNISKKIYENFSHIIIAEKTHIVYKEIILDNTLDFLVNLILNFHNKAILWSLTMSSNFNKNKHILSDKQVELANTAIEDLINRLNRECYYIASNLILGLERKNITISVVDKAHFYAELVRKLACEDLIDNSNAFEFILFLLLQSFSFKEDNFQKLFVLNALQKIDFKMKFRIERNRFCLNYIKMILINYPIDDSENRQGHYRFGSNHDYLIDSATGIQCDQFTLLWLQFYFNYQKRTEKIEVAKQLTHELFKSMNKFKFIYQPDEMAKKLDFEL